MPSKRDDGVLPPDHNSPSDAEALTEVQASLPPSPQVVNNGSDTATRPPFPTPAETETLAPSTAPATLEGVTVPGYEIVSELGRGGMGVVYKARQVSLNRFVALKMILAGPYAGADQLARFRLEAEAVASLQHPGIVQIHEIGSHAGHSYIALEYVSGGTLTAKCAGMPLPAAKAAELVEVLARTVEHAHRRGIVHRDLKPGNVLLTEDGTPRITDFGLAKRLDAEVLPSGPRTQSGAILGTPAYMAPEQASGKRGAVGPAADVYALGAILYELLTGWPPFRADNPVDVIVKVTMDEPVPPRALVASCPRDLEAVCLRCLNKDPARRYSSAEALADDLARFRSGKPTKARPRTAAERFRNWTWRRRWWILGGLTACAVLALLVVSLAFNALALFLTSAQPVNSFGESMGGVVASEGPAAEQAPATLPEDLDLVPRDAIMFLTVRVSDLWKRNDVQGWDEQLRTAKLANPSGAATAFEKIVPLRPGMIERATLVNLRQAPFPESVVAILATTEPYSRDEVKATLEKRGFPAREVSGRACFGPGPDGQTVICLVSDRVLVYSPREDWLRDWIARSPKQDEAGPLRPALDLAATGRHHLVAGTVPPRALREQVIKQMSGPFPGLRPEFRVQQPNLQPLVEVEAVALTAQLKSRADGASADGIDVEVRLGYPDSAAASQGQKALGAVVVFLAEVMKLYAAGAMEGVPPAIAQELMLGFRSARTMQQEGSGRISRRENGPPGLPRPGDSYAEGHLIFRMEWAPSWPAEAVTALRVEGDRLQSLNKLKQLGLAVWNYHDTFTHFPPAAIRDKAGKPLLSWRVAVLPYLDDGPELYKEFHLDEAWDSDHNKKLLARMPAVYAPPLEPLGWQPNTTFYQVFVGEKTMFPPQKKMNFANIIDGTSNTLMIVEAGEAVPWTKPADLPYDPDQPLPALGGIFHDGFQGVMADGRSGRFLPKSIPPATLRSLIDPADGKPLTPP